MAFEQTIRSVSHALASVGAVAATPLLVPGVSSVTRPVLKGGLRVYFGALALAGVPANWAASASRRTGELLESARRELAEVYEEAKAEQQALPRRRRAVSPALKGTRRGEARRGSSGRRSRGGASRSGR